MSEDIKEFTVRELLDDFVESAGDLALCELSVELGAVSFTTVKRRIEVNKAIKGLIREELLRRARIGAAVSDYVDW